MKNVARAWALSGLAHLGVLAILCIGVALGQGQLPIGENRPVPKAKPVPEIAAVALESLTPAAKAPETIELKPGQLKAFASGEQFSWLLVPKSDDATDEGLAYEEAAAGTVVFAFDVDRQRWGKFKVPDGGPVILVGCNPEARGKYLLVKQEVVGTKVRTVAQTYLVIAGLEPKPDPKPAPSPIPKPAPPVTARKISVVIVEETAEKSAARSVFFGDKALAEYWKSKGHPEPIVVDQHVRDGQTNLSPDKLKSYLDRAKGKKLPVIFLLDAATGQQLILESKVPGDIAPAEFLKLLQSLGG